MKKVLCVCFICCFVFTSCVDNNKVMQLKEDINVDVAFTIEKINPLSDIPDVNRLLPNIFSALVRFNHMMRIEPDLALFWGNIDDYTWEFKIRDNVYFHDGTKMDIDDIRATLQFVKDNSFLNTYSYVDTIESISVDNNMLRIKTKIKDPLLLQKLTHIFIVKKDDLKNKDVRIGSGKYKINELNKNRMRLSFFEKYYGDKPIYNNVNINFVEDKNKRFQDIIGSGADILADVPLEFISEIEKRDYLDIMEVSSLDTMFLIFNTKDNGRNFFVNKDFRKLIYDIINKDMIVEIAGERYADSINQFLNSNVLGFDPGLERIKNEIVSENDFKIRLKNIFGKEVNILLNILSTKTLSVITQNIQQQLFKYGINIETKILAEKEMENDLLEGDGHIYAIGWRFDLLDPVDFFDKILRYAKISSDNELWNLLEEIKNTMNMDKRIILIKNFSHKLITQDYIGAPLIETKNIYVKLKQIDWMPRADGAIIF